MAATIGFMILPGSYQSVIARLRKSFGSVVRTWAGSKSGSETIAKIAPVLGTATMATAASAS
ncbi:MAG: hypothetical protein AMJ75_08545 [Phycisphaerae bacterium SM1_79]|nr:MAG: hypothetical protein AMJ75_08545 [Phycisphaerae bacterium SM1_79]